MAETDHPDYCYVIAEIGSNHQGHLETARQLIRKASQCGVDAVKFQKRNNRSLFTKSYYNREYDNPESYGPTYGAHREALEFGRDEFIALLECARENSVDFLVTPFDYESVDFLEEIDIDGYKIASGDVTNLPLIRKVAAIPKPLYISTGAAELSEVQAAYQEASRLNSKLAMLHCPAAYPAGYPDLNLSFITRMKELFPGAVIGYSGHDNGILAASIAYMLGARVVEKHFTLNHSSKGTDHKFSLEPEGLRKQVRDLRRIPEMLGDGKKVLRDFEQAARRKLGKGIYSSRPIPAGTVIQSSDLSLKSPGTSLPPSSLGSVIGRTLRKDIAGEHPLEMEDFD